MLPRVRTRNLHEVTNKMKCVLHLKEEEEKRKKKKERKEKKVKVFYACYGGSTAYSYTDEPPLSLLGGTPRKYGNE